jgi:ubiquinone/menaquinone biosynthesis C-methylase UbiE
MATFTTRALGSSNCEYALGYSNAEHDRLIRQAVLIAPITERVFHEAGIVTGQRVLDLGSGLGDVSMAVARLVGPSGEVVGIERDVSSIARARARVDAAGLRNIAFIQGDVNDIASERTFDAAVGRFILMFLPDPLSVLKSVVRLVRPGGILAFQEPTWVPMLAMADRLPLWLRVLRGIHETFLRSGVNPEMGPDLHGGFQQIGLPAPVMHIDMLLGADARLISIFSDLLSSIAPLAEQHKVPLDELGDLDTLAERIREEIASASTMVGFVPIVSIWVRKPS